MAGNYTVLHPEAVDERIHNMSVLALQPEQIGEAAIEAAVTSEAVDYREVDDFISSSKDFFLRLGFFTFRRDSVELQRLGVFTTGNDYFDTLLSVEEAPETFETKNDLRAQQLLGLASIGLVFADETVDLPHTNETTTTTCFKEDSRSMRHIHDGSIERFFMIRGGRTSAAIQEIRDHFNNLRVKEEALAQLCLLRPELVGAMLFGSSATKQQISQAHSLSSSRSTKLKNFTTFALRPF